VSILSKDEARALKCLTILFLFAVFGVGVIAGWAVFR
jgi:hypothetical protein